MVSDRQRMVGGRVRTSMDKGSSTPCQTDVTRGGCFELRVRACAGENCEGGTRRCSDRLAERSAADNPCGAVAEPRAEAAIGADEPPRTVEARRELDDGVVRVARTDEVRRLLGRLAVEHDRQVVAFADRPFARPIHEPLAGDVRPAGPTDVLRIYDHERHTRSIGRGRTGRMLV